MDYVFYIKKSPLSDRDFKIGISGLVNMDSRLGTYQNAFGPSYKERFECVWLGPEQDIRELERLLKIKFRNKMAGSTRGFTEWVTDIDFNELCLEVQTLITSLGVTAERPKDVSQIFVEDIQFLKNMYLKEKLNA
jgi:hypothetical protein